MSVDTRAHDDFVTLLLEDQVQPASDSGDCLVPWDGRARVALMFRAPPVELRALSVSERQDAGIGLGFLNDGVPDVANKTEALIDRQTPIVKARPRS